MIDTIKFKMDPSAFKRPSNFEWKVSEGSHISEIDGQSVGWVKYQHSDSGLRVFGHDGFVENFEVSLPRLIYGSNGILLRGQDMNIAYRAALNLVSDVVENPCPLEVSRYDLVHHFHGLACDYIASLRGLKHKKVRKRCCEWFDSGLEWPGKDVHIRLYDKRLELEKVPGLVQRLEFQLRGRALNQIWSFDKGFDVNACYSHYRALSGQFSSRSVPKIGSTNELLSFLIQNDVKVRGICPVERFLSGKSRATRYRISKDLNSVRLDYFDANFMAFLPPDYDDLTFLDCVVEKSDADTTEPQVVCRVA